MSTGSAAQAVTVLQPDQLSGRVTGLPAGRTLPAGLLHARFGNGPPSTPICFQPGVAVCTLRFLEVAPGAPEQIVMLNGCSSDGYEQDGPDNWKQIGGLAGPVDCDAVQRLLRGGDVALVPHPAQDLLVGGTRLTVTPPPQECPSDAQH